MEYTDVSEVHTACIIRAMMEAVFASESSVYSNEITWHYIPEDFKLHNRRLENLKSHLIFLVLTINFITL
jgi:hypothetical protein